MSIQNVRKRFGLLRDENGLSDHFKRSQDGTLLARNRPHDILTVDDREEEKTKELIVFAPPLVFPGTKEQCIQERHKAVELPLEAIALVDSPIIHDTALFGEVGKVQKRPVTQISLKKLQPKTLTLDEQHKEPAYLRPLTPIQKMRPAVSGPDDFQHSAPFSAEAQE
uniref:Uncharacterized protein n=1 Tax=Angiostrongylus cantonensis TaxID=6313 RepID=A0A0K0DRU1_ANGCA